MAGRCLHAAKQLWAPVMANPPHDHVTRGIVLAILAMMVFATQDAVTKYLAQSYSAPQIVWIRYLLFSVFALILATRQRPLRMVLSSRRPILQIVRSLIIVAEIAIFVVAVRVLPLADAHALLATTPLMVTALSALFLGEAVGIRRWAAVGMGFVGVLVILRPGLTVLQPGALLALGAAFLFAVYLVLTRVIRTDDGETSLLYMALVGAAVMTLLGPAYWTWPTPAHWAWLVALSITSSLGHFLLIKALAAAPASTLQPFNYMLLVWATITGYVVFGHFPDAWTVTGAAIVVASGLYTILRERRLAAEARRQGESPEPARATPPLAPT